MHSEERISQQLYPRILLAGEERDVTRGYGLEKNLLIYTERWLICIPRPGLLAHSSSGICQSGLLYMGAWIYMRAMFC